MPRHPRADEAGLYNKCLKLNLLVVCAFFVGCDRGEPGQSSQHVDLKHFNGAIDNTEVTYDPHKSALYVRARKLLEKGDVNGAKLLYRRAIKIYPDDPSGYSSLGASLYFEQEYEDAREQYLRAIEIDARFVEACYGLGCVAYEQKQYDVAIDWLSQGIDISDDGDCHRVIGMTFDAIGDPTKAKAHYKKALALNASDETAKELLRRFKLEDLNSISKP